MANSVDRMSNISRLRQKSASRKHKSPKSRSRTVKGNNSQKQRKSQTPGNSHHSRPLSLSGAENSELQ